MSTCPAPNLRCIQPRPPRFLLHNSDKQIPLSLPRIWIGGFGIPDGVFSDGIRLNVVKEKSGVYPKIPVDSA